MTPQPPYASLTQTKFPIMSTPPVLHYPQMSKWWSHPNFPGPFPISSSNILSLNALISAEGQTTPTCHYVRSRSYLRSTSVTVIPSLRLTKQTTFNFTVIFTNKAMSPFRLQSGQQFLILYHEFSHLVNGIEAQAVNFSTVPKIRRQHLSNVLTTPFRQLTPLWYAANSPATDCNSAVVLGKNYRQ